MNRQPIKASSVAEFEHSSDWSDLERIENTETKMKTCLIHRQKERQFLNELERKMVQKMFESHINLFKVLGKIEIINIQKKEELLAKYDWRKLKYCVHNMIQCKKRMLSRTSDA